MQYELNVSIGSKGLKAIYGAGQCVTLVKPILAFVQTSMRPAPALGAVGWIAFKPFSSNTMQWKESYTGYVTTTSPTTGGVIVMRSTTNKPMSAGSVYTFSKGGFQDSPGLGASYVIANATEDQMQFGLAQCATVNDKRFRAPAVITPALGGQQAYFTPGTSVLLFLSSAQQNGTLLPAVPANALTIDCSSSTPAQVEFNDTTNQFHFIS